LLEQNGVEGVTRMLEYQKLKSTSTIALTEDDGVYFKTGDQQYYGYCGK